ncbi:MAG TPA: hypothetical protein VHQ64_11030, partial [Pyrinomonadaceae bacterium]|nr:hypothetical protein [Pyrinomonadaceae bacterium]
VANVAWILASNGFRVLAVDWDLEAPGLHRYFYPFLIDRDLTASRGIIDFMIDFEYEVLNLGADGRPNEEWFQDRAQLSRYTASLDWTFPRNGKLDFIPAGRQTDSYSARVNSFNWPNFYEQLGGGLLLEAVKARMRNDYDYILIDSRTGVSDASGICSVQLPDSLVVCFTLNHQSIEGAGAVAASVYEHRRLHDPPIKIFPVPMRIEIGEKDKLELRRDYARKQFDLFPAHMPREKQKEYWSDVEVLYVPYYAYEEILAPFGDRGGQAISLLSSVERLTGYLTDGDLSREIESFETSDEERERILSVYARQSTPDASPELVAKTAEQQLVIVAERVFASFSADQQEQARRLFTRLVQVPAAGSVDEDYSRLRVRKADLPLGDKHVVDELLYRQLLVLDANDDSKETLELSDEVLANHWPRLQDWLNADREFLLWRQGLDLAISRWEQTNKSEDALLHGAFLIEAQHYHTTRTDDLNKRESAFIARSVRADSISRRAFNNLKLESHKIRNLNQRLIVWGSVVLLVVIAAVTIGYQFVFHRERAFVFFGLQPRTYEGDWSDDFFINVEGKPEQSKWDYPRDGSWTIVKGEGQASDDGALVVSGKNIGQINIAPKVLTNFNTEFKVRLIHGTKAAWMFRLQSDKQRGYLFVLETNAEIIAGQTKGVVIHGYAITSQGKQVLLDNENHGVPLPNCCQSDDAFRIRAEVEGNQFTFRITLESTTPPDQPPPELNYYGVEWFVNPFTDARSLFHYGNLGFLETEDGDAMQVEYLRVSETPAR